MSSRKRSGFALADLVLTLAIGTVLVTLVRPQQTETGRGGGGRTFQIASNERAVVKALRTIAAAQAQLAASGAIDTDGDGVGEYGFFGELAGTAPLRIQHPVDGAPALDPTGQVLSPPLLPRAFGNVVWDARGENVVRRHGYVFKMFLPDAPIAHHVADIPETGNSGVGGATAGNFPDPDTGEELWCCYAWPLRDQLTGQRVFFINQEGQVLQTENDGPGLVYNGFNSHLSMPAFDAAYSDVPASPNGFTGMAALLGIPPLQSNDGNDWMPTGK